MTLTPSWPAPHDESSRDNWGDILLAGLGEIVDALRLLQLTITSVKTAAYTAGAGDFVPVDATAANRTITLPTDPADETLIGVKAIAVGAGKTITMQCGGGNVIDKAGGSATLTLETVNECVIVKFKASTGIWYVVTHSYSKAGLAAALSGTYQPVLDAAIPAIAYNGDGTIHTVTYASGVVITYTYNADGTIHTASDGTMTRTFTYNGDGTLASVA